MNRAHAALGRNLKNAAGVSRAMIYLTAESNLENSKGITGIYFYAQWLILHKKMKIMVEKVELQNKNIKFYAVDIDSFPSLCKRFSIDSIPTIVITGDGGSELDRIDGMPLTSAFRKTFADIYNLYNLKK